MLGRSKEDWENVANQLADAGLVVLAVDLRGHGRSSGATAMLPPMVGDLRAAVTWIAARPNVVPGGIALVGASLGANLAALAAADSSQVRAVALLSPSLDYRGIRIDGAVIKKIGTRPMWLAASMHDPYALRTLKSLSPMPDRASSMSVARRRTAPTSSPPTPRSPGRLWTGSSGR